MRCRGADATKPPFGLNHDRWVVSPIAELTKLRDRRTATEAAPASTTPSTQGVSCRLSLFEGEPSWFLRFGRGTPPGVGSLHVRSLKKKIIVLGCTHTGALRDPTVKWIRFRGLGRRLRSRDASRNPLFFWSLEVSFDSF